MQQRAYFFSIRRRTNRTRMYMANAARLDATTFVADRNFQHSTEHVVDERPHEWRHRTGRPSSGGCLFRRSAIISVFAEGADRQVSQADRELSRHLRLCRLARHAVALGCARCHRVSSRADEFSKRRRKRGAQSVQTIRSSSLRL
jgi:hypothetical protein